MTPDIDIWRCVNVIKKRYGGVSPFRSLTFRFMS